MTTTGHSTFGRSVASFGTTLGAAAVTAPANTFSQDDVGASVVATGVPAGTTIASVQSDTAATLSANATATGSVTATIGDELATSAGFTGWVPETAAEADDYTIASVNAGTTPLGAIGDTHTRVAQYSEH